MKKIILSSFLLAWQLFWPSQAHSQMVGAGKAVDPYHYNITKSKTFDHASVACAHPLASAVGAEIMKRGGNAFDAAVAVAAA
ncbi:MAG: gamma-glutamyltransferase, partial [Bacteroidota bacterium]|nr:gamma-glutamyltransferase [Bacteroidota bacterium]